MNQFMGHTHKDEFKVFYDTISRTRPFATGFVTPSVTPHKNVNPAYRIYTVDGDYEGSTRVRKKIKPNLCRQSFCNFFRGCWTTTPTLVT